jgi:capsule polysaccharide export protein KpsE/RkpR
MVKIKKVKLTLTRDETIAIDQFLPYWILLCESKASQRNEIENYRMTWNLFKCIVQQIKIRFDKRIKGIAQYHIFSFSPAEAIVLTEFLMKHPIAADQFWLFKLRQTIIDTLHPQI